MSENGHDGVWKELLRVLDREVEKYEKLILVLSRKQEAIIGGDVELLRQLVAEEQSLVKEIEGIVKERNRLGSLLVSSQGELKLNDIIDVAPEEFKELVLGIRYRLISNMEQISRLNRENEYLLNFSIDFVRNMTQLMVGIGGESMKIYNARGYTFSPGENSKLVDCQI